MQLGRLVQHSPEQLEKMKASSEYGNEVEAKPEISLTPWEEYLDSVEIAHKEYIAACVQAKMELRLAVHCALVELETSS